MAEARHRSLRRAGIIALGVVLAIGGLVVVIVFFSARDTAPVRSVRGPGEAFADQGAAHLKPGARPATHYNSDPPTSGPHVERPVRRDAAELTNDELLSALEAGNVVLVYDTPVPPPALRSVAKEVAGPFEPALAQSGQAVVLARRPGTRGVVALAWRHLLRARSPGDPGLREFADFWLGRGRRQR